MKRISMELGGKSPFIILPGADYEKAVRMCFNSLLLNSGQTCTALSRLIIPKEAKAEIEQIILKVLPEYTVGDPTLETTKVGAVASKEQWNIVDSYIAKGIEEGATVLAGGRPEPPEKGYFINPTVFTDVTNDMTIAQEEIFGPVSASSPMKGSTRHWPSLTTPSTASTAPSGVLIRKKPRRLLKASCRATSTSTAAARRHGAFWRL